MAMVATPSFPLHPPSNSSLSSTNGSCSKISSSSSSSIIPNGSSSNNSKISSNTSSSIITNGDNSSKTSSSSSSSIINSPTSSFLLLDRPSLPPAHDPACKQIGSSVEQLPPLPKEYLDPNQPGSRIRTRKPFLHKLPNRKRFPAVDKWGPRAAALVEATELVKHADGSEEALVANFDGWTKYLSARDIVAIIDEEPTWQNAYAFFKWLKKKGTFELNMYVYNVLIKSLRRGGQWKIASNLVEEMIRDGLKPDKVTYSTLINFAMRCKLPQESLKWYERMQDAGCSPDSVTYNTMIDVYGRMGCIREAFEIYFKLRQENMRLDVFTYSTIIRLYGIQGNYDSMLSVYEEMSSTKIIPNVVTFNTMIGALGKSGKVYQVTRLFDDMQKLDVQPSVITLNLLIRIYGRCRLVDEAFQVFYSMEKHGWKADITIYNAILNICAQQGLVKAGEQIFEEMMESRTCCPDDWTWMSMIEMYALEGMMVEARDMFQQMLGAGLTADTSVYTFLMKGYSENKDFKAVVELFEKLVAEGIALDEHVSAALLSALVLCEEKEEREAIFECIEKANSRLGRVVDLLVQDDFDFDAVKEEIRALFAETWEDSRRPFCNILIDLCWARNLGGRTFVILAFANQIGVYSDIQIHSISEWRLNLRTLSFGAARTALEGWLHTLSSTLNEGIDLPPHLCINTKSGGRGSYEASMSNFVRSQMEEIKAPFEEATEQHDLFVSTGDAAVVWLSCGLDRHVP